MTLLIYTSFEDQLHVIFLLLNHSQLSYNDLITLPTWPCLSNYKKSLWSEYHCIQILQAEMINKDMRGYTHGPLLYVPDKTRIIFSISLTFSRSWSSNRIWKNVVNPPPHNWFLLQICSTLISNAWKYQKNKWVKLIKSVVRQLLISYFFVC